MRHALDALITEAAAVEQPERLRFPPVLPRRQIEEIGYLKSFPHLAGTIFAFDGDEEQATTQDERAGRHEDWSEFQEMTDLVLTPAACYPVYPAIAARGPLAAGGHHRRRRRRLRLQARALRRPRRACRCSTSARSCGSASPRRCSPGAMPGATAAVALLRALGLDASFEVASDPFFGRTGGMLGPQPARTGAEVRGAGADRRPRADRGRLVQLPPGPLRPPTGSSSQAASRAHRVPWLRPRAHRARAAARARARPCAWPAASARASWGCG